MQKSSVFISYVHKNFDVVDRLKTEIEALGIKVWIDREDISPGQYWKHAIKKPTASFYGWIVALGLNK